MWRYNIATTNMNGHAGDGVVMARELDAAVLDMGNQMLFPFNDSVTFSAENVSGTFADSPVVNKAGKRFVDETTDRFTMAAALMREEDSLCYFISDAERIYGTEASPGEETLLRRGQLFKADTLESLAAQVGFDPKTFVDEVAKFNGYVSEGRMQISGVTSFQI